MVRLKPALWMGLWGVLCVFWGGTATAQLKLAYVNSQEILAQYPPALEAQKKLQQEAMVWQQELEAMSKEIQTLQERLEKQGLMLSEAKKQEIEQELQTKYLKAQQFQNEKWGEDGEFARRRVELLQPVIDKINAVIKKVGDEGGYDFIFDTVAGNLLYAQEKHDLTARIIQELKK